MNDQIPIDESDKKPQRKGIQSLVTGFQVIDFLLRCGKPMPLREISKGTGLAPSKLQFYLISLMEVRVVHQDPQSGYYGLGPYTLQLGIAGLQQFDIFEAARQKMEALSETHGCTVFMGVWGNQGPTIVHRVSGDSTRSLFELRLGSVLPVLRSALGRVFYAYLPDEITKAAVDREMSEAAPGLTEQDPEMATPKNLASLKTLRERIHQHSMSRSRGGLLLDHTAISAPVFDYRHRIIAGITAMGPIQGLDDSFDGQLAQDLRKIAEDISQEAGQTTEHYLEI